MSVVRLGRLLCRTIFNALPDLRALKASGRVPTKPGLNSRGEFRDVKCTRVCTNRSLQAGADRRVISRNLWRGLTARVGLYANGQAAVLRRMAMSHLLKGCGLKAPVFAFLGFAYVSVGSNTSPPKDVQEEEQFRKMQYWIQGVLQTSHQASQHPANDGQPSISELKLKDFEIGERLGERSCCSVVYAAKNKEHEYAVKMLFNFGTNSQSSSLHKGFAKEWQVLSVQTQENTSIEGLTYTSLPPHPNICPILGAFADDVPCLPDAISNYPAALPPLYGEGSFGRNRTLFLVMPRYNRTVREFLASNQSPDQRIATFLMLQLLQGISHLTRHGISHRDLKTDNLLLDEIAGDSCPQLAIADFGCCLADKQWGLKLPFITEEIDRGGNIALMAPEIVCAVPGKNAVLDYTKSDAWAAAAISYELFGDKNPFGGSGLDSRTYQDEQLPLLEHAQSGVKKVVTRLLKRDPSERITADMATVMLALILWAPAEWLQPNSHVAVIDINRWLIGLSFRVLTSTRTFTSEDQVLCRFLCRADGEDVMDALDLLKEDIV